MKQAFPAIFWIILIYGILNLVQATFMELDPDEAYYWMYAQQLDWGYFDHPPMVAILIRLSSFLGQGELSVRFWTVIMGCATLYIVWLLADKPKSNKDLFLLMALLLAMPMANIYGFITTPDPPLLFFTACFFYLYRLFLEKDSWLYTFMLGGCMALLLYSKYHGVLVILFTLASNWRLLLNPRFYVASIFGALLFFPHLYWQFVNDFPSLKYHLVGRNRPLELKHPINFILNQVVNFSPVLFPLWFLLLRKGVSKQPLLRAFYFCITGFWGFFLLLTVKGHAEPQWTAVLCIPLAILAFQYLKAHKWRGLFFRLSLVSIALLLVARLLVIVNWSKPYLPQFHKKEWINALQEKAEGKPVAFLNNYRDPSTYAFYTGEEIAVFNFPIEGRSNQYDIWSLEKSVQAKEVLLFGFPEWKSCPGESHLEVKRKRRKTCEVGPIQVTQKVHFEFEPTDTIVMDESQSSKVLINNPYAFDLDFEESTWPLECKVILTNEDKIGYFEFSIRHEVKMLAADNTITTDIQYVVSEVPKGIYTIAIMMEGGDGILRTINSDFFEVFIQEGR